MSRRRQWPRQRPEDPSATPTTLIGDVNGVADRSGPSPRQPTPATLRGRQSTAGQAPGGVPAAGRQRRQHRADRGGHRLEGRIGRQRAAASAAYPPRSRPRPRAARRSAACTEAADGGPAGRPDRHRVRGHRVHQFFQPHQRRRPGRRPAAHAGGSDMVRWNSVRRFDSAREVRRRSREGQGLGSVPRGRPGARPSRPPDRCQPASAPAPRPRRRTPPAPSRRTVLAGAPARPTATARRRSRAPARRGRCRPDEPPPPATRRRSSMSMRSTTSGVRNVATSPKFASWRRQQRRDTPNGSSSHGPNGTRRGSPRQHRPDHRPDGALQRPREHRAVVGLEDDARP